MWIGFKIASQMKMKQCNNNKGMENVQLQLFHGLVLLVSVCFSLLSVITRWLIANSGSSPWPSINYIEVNSNRKLIIGTLCK
jgi:hypothetical protein